MDCDNFIAPYTLKSLIEKNKPIIAPLLHSLPEAHDVYSNFFADVDNNGYYKDHPDFFKISNREVVGTFKVPVVHHVYLIKSEVIDKLTYIDESSDWEFIVFSRSARHQQIPQYICNERDFGSFIHFYKNLSLNEEAKAFEHIHFQFNLLEGRLRSTDKRYATLKKALQLMEERNVKTIVETGTARDGDRNFEGDGGSTILFGEWASQHGASLFSIDINEQAIQEAKQAAYAFKDHILFMPMDSVQALTAFPRTIDFLYLDSFDFDFSNPLPSQQHHLKEIEAAYDKLTSNSIVMIDDCKLPHGGKGKEVISFLQKRGWKILEDGYQVIMTKETPDPSFLTLAKQQENANQPPQIVIQCYKKAHESSPNQIDPLYYLSCFYRKIGKLREACETAEQGYQLLKNPGCLFEEKWIYDFGMLWEYSLCQHSVGAFEEAISSSKEILKLVHISPLQREILNKNISYYIAGLQVREFANNKWGPWPLEKTKGQPQLHVCTLATHSCQGLDQLLTSCRAHQIDLVILGMNKPSLLVKS